VAFEPIASGADGFYRPTTKAIVVEASHSPNRRVKTLVHELAHALVRADRQEEDPELDHAAEELVAETVAYSVCASSGIEPGEFSISYLAGWSERTPIATIEGTAALIDRLSRRIEDAVAAVALEPAGESSRYGRVVRGPYDPAVALSGPHQCQRRPRVIRGKEVPQGVGPASRLDATVQDLGLALLELVNDGGSGS
jgi:hypothetical protein